MRKFLLGIPVLLTALVVLASAAAAGPPATATGAYAVTGAPTVNDIRVAGGNTFIAESLPFIFLGDGGGDLFGPGVLQGTVVVKPDGSGESNSTFVCTGCTVGGRTGDFTGLLRSHFTGFPTGPDTGTVTVLSATGGLAGLHGQDHFEGSPLAGRYSFKYSFDP